MGYRLVSFEKGAGDYGTAEQPQPQQRPRYRLVQPPPEPYSGNEEGKADMQSLPASIQARDAAKSFGSGLVQGATALAGTIGDVQDLAGEGVAYLAGKAGASRETQEGIRRVASQAPSPFTMGLRAPRSQEIQAKVEEFTGPMYEPQTQAGRIANTAGQFAPNVIAGPGGIIRKAAMTVIPALASEGAAAATEGSKYQPLAKAGAAVAATLATGGRGKSTKLIAKNAPTQEAVKTATNQNYRQLRAADIVYDTNSFGRYMGYLANKLKAEGIAAPDAPRSAAIIDELGGMASGRIDYQNFESIRKRAARVAREAESTDRAASAIILRALDSFAERAPLATNGRVPANVVNSLQKQARELAQRGIFAREIDDMLEKANTYQSGTQAGIRNQFSNYLRSKKGMRLSKQAPELHKAMSEAAKGNFTTNLLTHLGRFGVDPTRMGNIATLIPGAAAGATYAYTQDPVTAAAVLAAGSGAKLAGRKLTVNAAQRAKKVALAGREAQKKGSSQVAARNTRTAGTAAMSAQESTAGPAQWPQGAFMQDANGRFYDRNGQPLSAR